jgi:hypothetical protein
VKPTLAHTLPVACFYLKSAWQAVLLRSALTVLLAALLLNINPKVGQYKFSITELIKIKQ